MAWHGRTWVYKDRDCVNKTNKKANKAERSHHQFFLTDMSRIEAVDVPSLQGTSTKPMSMQPPASMPLFNISYMHGPQVAPKDPKEVVAPALHSRVVRHNFPNRDRD
mgnify:CR=1 FL=1